MAEEKYYPSLQAGCLYHIYNRGNNHERIFYLPENYEFFLLRLQKYLSPYLTFYSYCLIPNHFHLLARVKDEDECPSGSERPIKAGLPNIHLGISEAFRRFFMSYAKAINKQEGRSGSLFQKNFKRKWIPTKEDMIAVILYIHANPTHHKLTKDFRYYAYSSYKDMLTAGSPSWLNTDEVIQLFGGKEKYRRMHEQYTGQNG